MSITMRFGATFLALLFRTSLHPAIPTALLAVIKYCPENVRSRLLEILPSASTLNIRKVKSLLQILIVIGVMKMANRVMSAWAANNWHITVPHTGWRWHKEIAVVTGGCSGIGKDIVKGLNKRGVKVAVLDIQDMPKDLETGILIKFFRCDITSSASVAETSKSVQNTLGHPTILINNAGLGEPHSILNTSDEYLRNIFAVNVISHWYTTRHFLPRMIQQNKGHVVTVASLASFITIPTIADYSATKAGALAFHEALTSELKHLYKAPGVLTTCVHPNFVATPLVEKYGADITRGVGTMLKSEVVAGKILDNIFQGRGGQVIIPRALTPVSGIRGWPTWLQELVRDLLGRATISQFGPSGGMGFKFGNKSAQNGS